MPFTKKAETHERIVEKAARAIRREGYDGVSVADIMKEAGLTHGGFYAHFDSRDDLVVEALERAASESLANLTAEVDGAPEGKGLATLAARYLSDAHVKEPEAGCTLAALGSETRRQPIGVRALAARHVKTFSSLIERLLPTRKGSSSQDEARRDEARVILSALVGSIVIARAVDNAELSKAFRAAVRRFVDTKKH
jgi:TetR/AcrR family transcriptional regulator, transcriptional repressor for nem operon